MPTVTEFLHTHWRSAVEIAVLAVVCYYGYLYFRGTRGAKVFIGLLLTFLAVVLFANLLNLAVLSFLIRELSVIFAVVLVVLFQPEIRRVLAELGSRHFLPTSTHNREIIDALADAVFELSHRKFGALVAIEREIDLKIIAESGVRLDALFSVELATTIFHPKTSLHDGGMILREERVLAAACIFPVSQRENLDRSLGLRHRAALGLSEESDAITIIVSEETGQISLCHRGKIERDLDKESLKRRLQLLMVLEKYEENDPEQLES